MTFLMRAVGLTLVLASGGGLGAWRLSLWQKRLLLYGELERLLSLLRQEIEGRGLPLAQLLPQALGRYPFRFFHGGQASTPCELCLPDWCPDTQRELFAACFRGLGSQDTETTAQELLYYEAVSRSLAQQAEEKLKTARQLYCPLGVCGGAALALLIL